MENIYLGIESILNEHFFIKPAQGVLRRSFVKDLGLSSLEFVELVVYIENNFNVLLPDSELTQVNTIKQMKECIERNLVSQNI